MGDGIGLNILLTGLAGAGKSRLTASLGSWLEREQGFDVCYVNFDAGAESLPYAANVDIRDFVRVERLMKEERLGMNGAIVMAAERSVNYLPEVLSAISKRNAGFTLIDSPGQQEIFVFRNAGPRTAEALQRHQTTIALHIIDSTLAQSPSALATALALATASHLRLALPTLSVVNKIDLGGAEAIARMISDPKVLRKMIEGERAGAMTDMALELLDHIERVMTAQRPLMVSAVTNEGISELYKAINEATCVCGDLT